MNDFTTEIDAHQFTTGELAAALANCDYGCEVRAAIWLLTQHEHWLRRRDFRSHITAWESEGTTYASVNWLAIDFTDTTASSSEIGILRIAAALASRDIGVNLRRALSGLDRTNAALVVNAVAIALGQKKI